MKANVKVSMIT